MKKSAKYLVVLGFILYLCDFDLQKMVFVPKSSLMIPNDTFMDLRYISPGNTTSTRYFNKNKNNFIILMWNLKIWLKPILDSFNVNRCRTSKNCIFTVDPSLFNKSKAVIFFLDGFLDGKRILEKSRLRTPNQVWVFVYFEAHCHLHRNLLCGRREWVSAFNWSMGFNVNSDIFLPYGKLHQRSRELPEKDYSKIYRGKRKFAAWAVSHCTTRGEREKYVNILRQYIDVDIFGYCGNGRVNYNVLAKVISKEYYFYLSFENALTQDYVTEKFFRNYALDVITVVRGKIDYSLYFPKDSFVDTQKFSNISSLAEFLKSLAGNEKEYIKYLKTKDKFTVYDRKSTFPDALCNVCNKLNNLERNRRTYSNFSKLFEQCDEASDLNP